METLTEEYLISLENRLQEIKEHRRGTIEGMTFWNSIGGDRIMILDFDSQTRNFTYRRTFPVGEEIVTSSDVSVLGDLSNYFDVETVHLGDMERSGVFDVSRRALREGFPSRKPQLGPSPAEEDEFFRRLMNSPSIVQEGQERARLNKAIASQPRYVDSTEYEDGEAD